MDKEAAGGIREVKTTVKMPKKIWAWTSEGPGKVTNIKRKPNEPWWYTGTYRGKKRLFHASELARKGIIFGAKMRKVKAWRMKRRRK